MHGEVETMHATIYPITEVLITFEHHSQIAIHTAEIVRIDQLAPSS